MQRDWCNKAVKPFARHTEQSTKGLKCSLFTKQDLQRNRGFTRCLVLRSMPNKHTVKTSVKG